MGQINPSADHYLMQTIRDLQTAVLELQTQNLFPVLQMSSDPVYIKGAVYFNTTTNKLKIGGATGWETVTSS